MRRLRWIIPTLAAAILLAALAYTYAPGRLDNRPRIAWKNTALDEIAARLADDNWLQAELASLNAPGRKTRAPGQWFTDELLLMQDGQWLIVRSVCKKQRALIHDLFLARAADGNWYYSTYHFCIGRIILHDESQPATLDTFIQTYHLKPFAPTSDECLNLTWPPPTQ